MRKSEVALYIYVETIRSLRTFTLFSWYENTKWWQGELTIMLLRYYPSPLWYLLSLWIVRRTLSQLSYHRLHLSEYRRIESKDFIVGTES